MLGLGALFLGGGAGAGLPGLASMLPAGFPALASNVASLVPEELTDDDKRNRLADMLLGGNSLARNMMGPL